MDDESADREAGSGSMSRSEPAVSTAAASARTTAAMIVGAVALVSVLVVVGWRLTVRPKAAPPPGPEASVADSMAKGSYNVVLQVRAQDPSGGMASVGTTLPGRLTLKFLDAEGKTYLEKFDRVGLWAIEMLPGTYWIPPAQDGLGEWKWKIAGETLVSDGAKGWKFTLAAGTINPMIELLLK